MNLKEKSNENIVFMVEKIKDKLQIVNAGAIKAESFDIEKYDDLLEIYEMITKKSSFSVRELDAIVSELANLRKK